MAWVPDWLLYLLVLALFAALLAGVLAIAWPRSESHSLIKKIAHFGPRRSAPSTVAAPEPTSAGARIARTVLLASAAVVRAGRLEERIAARLERAARAPMRLALVDGHHGPDLMGSARRG